MGKLDSWTCSTSRGTGGGGRGRETIPSAKLLPPEWFCIQMGMGSSVSHFNVSVIVGGQSHNQTVSINILREGIRSGSHQSSSAYQPSALPLGETGSQVTKRRWRRAYVQPFRVTLEPTSALDYSRMTRSSMDRLLCDYLGLGLV